ncbi:MAG: FecR domain-containing protein [Candidatus Omnitrophica bacterium]|nr:FecR domain-containing protein [Candidatus Omnitrophota bacterium]
MKYFMTTLTFLIAAVLPAGPIFSASESHVKVIYVKGKASFMQSGKTEWKDVEKGTVLRSGDSVKTQKDSSIEIAFGGRENNVISINADTHVVISLKGEEKVELIDGELFALVKKLPPHSRFEIRTPTAVCGARGTGWGTNANNDRTIVSAYENDSYAKGIDQNGNIMEKNLTVTEGFQTTVGRFQKPSQLSKLSGKDYDKWNSWKNNFIERTTARRKIRERLARDMNKIGSFRDRMEDRKVEDRLRKTTEETSAGSGSSCTDDQHYERKE